MQEDPLTEGLNSMEPLIIHHQTWVGGLLSLPEGILKTSYNSGFAKVQI